MSWGFERPGILLLAMPFAWLVWYLYKREEKSHFIHPLADHLIAHCGSGTFRSHLSFLFSVLAGAGMIFFLAGPWQGTREVHRTEKARLIGNIIDVSGSMSGEPLETAVKVAKHLIESYPEDRINVAFFASESSVSPFGIPVSYLTNKRVAAMAQGLGGNTVATHGLFTEFVAIAREEGLLTEEELAGIFNRAKTEDSRESQETRERMFTGYLRSVTSQHPPKINDRLAHFISDCDLSLIDYDVASVMALYKAYGIRIETICIGNTDLNRGNENDKKFVEGVLASGGHIMNLPVSMKSSEGTLADRLKEVVLRIEKMKPREVGHAVTLEKKSLDKQFFFASLLFLVIAAFFERRLA